MPERGGRLSTAARQDAAGCNCAVEDWLDLSTSLNPWAYPVPAIDPACWHRLPQDNDGLVAAAAAYYGNDRLRVLPGSQAAIRWLPALFRPVVVACLTPIDGVHAQAWERAGHKLRRLHDASLARALAAATPIIVLGNPDNPTARTWPAVDLLDAAGQLQRRGGWLVVDEGLGDGDPDHCVTPFAGSAQAPNLIVLRSLGNFFGLAGARVGFVFGASEKLDGLRAAIGPWPVSGPGRAVARQALADTAWQARTRQAVVAAAARLAALLAPCGEVTHCPLFVTVATPQAAELFEHLARRAILTRHFPLLERLRCGLPGSDAEWQRLAAALENWNP